MITAPKRTYSPGILAQRTQLYQQLPSPFGEIGIEVIITVAVLGIIAVIVLRK